MSNEFLRESALKWLKEKSPSHEQIADKFVETANKMYELAMLEFQQDLASKIAKVLNEISVSNDRK